MTDIKQKLNEIYTLYSAGEYEKANALNYEVLLSDPSNSYARRYKDMLSSYIKSDDLKAKVSKGVSLKHKGRSIRCSSCDAKLVKSSLTSDEAKRYDDFSKKITNSFSYKCKYCGKEMFLTGSRISSKIGYNLGKVVSVDDVKYRVTGLVSYRGTRHEDGGKGNLRYKEWTLVSEKGDYLYISESISDGYEEEYSISKKTLPKFQFHRSGDTLYIQDIPIYNCDYSEVEIDNVYGENTKKYSLGERIKLYEPKINGASYAFEFEGDELGAYEVFETTKEALLGRESIRSDGKEMVFGMPQWLVNLIFFGTLIWLLAFIGNIVFLFFSIFAISFLMPLNRAKFILSLGVIFFLVINSFSAFKTVGYEKITPGEVIENGEYLYKSGSDIIKFTISGDDDKDVYRVVKIIKDASKDKVSKSSELVREAYSIIGQEYIEPDLQIPFQETSFKIRDESFIKDIRDNYNGDLYKKK